MPCSLDDEAPYVNIDLGSIVLLGYRGAAAIDAARAAGEAAIPSHVPASLGLPPVGAEAGVINSEYLSRHPCPWRARLRSPFKPA